MAVSTLAPTVARQPARSSSPFVPPQVPSFNIAREDSPSVVNQHLTLVNVAMDPRIFQQEAAHRAEISNLQLTAAQQLGGIAEVRRAMLERHEEDRTNWENAFNQYKTDLKNRVDGEWERAKILYEENFETVK